MQQQRRKPERHRAEAPSVTSARAPVAAPWSVASGGGKILVAERPLRLQLRAVGARDGVDEVVPALAGAVRLEQEVARAREQHAVPGQAAEEIVLQLGVLARLGDV